MNGQPAVGPLVASVRLRVTEGCSKRTVTSLNGDM